MLMVHPEGELGIGSRYKKERDLGCDLPSLGAREGHLWCGLRSSEAPERCFEASFSGVSWRLRQELVVSMSKRDPQGTVMARYIPIATSEPMAGSTVRTTRSEDSMPKIMGMLSCRVMSERALQGRTGLDSTHGSPQA